MYKKNLHVCCLRMQNFIKILNIKSKFFMYESVLTLISKLHKDSSIH